MPNDLTAAGSRWLLLIHQLPPKPNYLRVKVARHMQRIGAVAIKNTVYVLPATDSSLEDFHWALREIRDGGGEANLFEARVIEGLSDGEVQQLSTPRAMKTSGASFPRRRTSSRQRRGRSATPRRSVPTCSVCENVRARSVRSISSARRRAMSRQHFSTRSQAGNGLDIIDYDPARRHLYVPGAKSATMTIFSVGTNGMLTTLGTVSTVRGAHCVTTDGKDAYVCDPDGGRLLVIHDSFPAAKP